MAHPDSVLIRRMLCGAIGSAEIHELSVRANDQSGDLTEATHATSACSASSPAGQLAPAADTALCAAGASLFVPCHADSATSQRQ